MSFDVELAARSRRSRQRLLSDFVADTATHTAHDKLVLPSSTSRRSSP